MFCREAAKTSCDRVGESVSAYFSSRHRLCKNKHPVIVSENALDVFLLAELLW
jgi:hypothetical protein